MSRRLVLDASAAIEAVLGRPQAEPVIAQLEDAEVVMAPSLICSEIANSLWKYVRSGELSSDGAISLHETALELVDVLVPDRDLATEALAEAARQGHPVYDLCYVVLARRHGAALVTLDRRLAALAERMSIPVTRP